MFEAFSTILSITKLQTHVTPCQENIYDTEASLLVFDRVLNTP